MPITITRGRGVLRTLSRDKRWWREVESDIAVFRAEQLVDDLQKNAPRDTGKTRKRVRRVGPQVKVPLHLHVLSEGRKRGARMPPSNKLRPWVRRRWGVRGRAANAAAFVLARSIARKGIKPRRLYKQSIERTRIGEPSRALQREARRYIENNWRAAAWRNR